MFTPIFFISANIIFEGIGLKPRWPFLFGHQFVGGMPYYMIILSPFFRRIVSKKFTLNLASLSLMINCGISWCLTHISNNNFAKLKIVVIILIITIFANLETRLTTMRMASIPFHSSSWVMKSMEMFSHGLFGINKGLYNPYFFLYINFVLWDLTQVCTKCSTSSFILG